MSASISSNYVLGQSVHEYERLMLQGRLLRPYTEKFFRAAGVVPGMRVLDIGSGMGDVALLAASTAMLRHWTTLDAVRRSKAVPPGSLFKLRIWTNSRRQISLTR
jgi:2-polyprenyl-3-methyl-5-hydroxy-6-metoxy-1,4-benzoquinol methylase